jgi:hypothetical protein
MGLGKFEGDNLVNLNFVDDTLIFLLANTRMLGALKMILLGLKINISKSKLVPLNLASHEGLHYANFIGCKLSSFTINCLGVPLHSAKLKKQELGLSYKLLSLGVD